MQEVRGRSQVLLDEWSKDISGGWSSTTDGLPASIHYVHWLEEKLSERMTMQQGGVMRHVQITIPVGSDDAPVGKDVIWEALANFVLHYNRQVHERKMAKLVYPGATIKVLREDHA